MVIQKQQGMASSYDYTDCYCPARFSSLALNPGSFDLLPLYVQDLASLGTYVDCNGYLFYYDETYGTGWIVDDLSVIEMDSQVNYQADAVAPGTATVTGSFPACAMYDTNPDLNCPCIEWNTFTGASVGNVCGFSISSPPSGQVYNMGGSNYDQATVPLQAASACSGSANWTLNFKYTTANGSSYTGSATTSTTIGQSTNYTTPVGLGGQVNAQVQATLAGQSFTQSVTFYVLGTQIPNSTIGIQLYYLYSSGATQGLLTGIAMHESGYAQFHNYAEMGLTGLWPYGNQVTGPGASLDSYVGLMQVPNGMADGFNWYKDTQDGYSTLEGKVGTVQNWVSGLRNQYPNLPDLSPTQYEDNELVLYAGDGQADYVWAPNSSDTGWAEITTTAGYLYVYAQANPQTGQQAGVRNEIQPQ